MRLTELVVVYVALGLGCAVAVAKRRPAGGAARPADLVLTAVFWPLYAPTLLSPQPPVPTPASGAGGLLEREHRAVMSALASVSDPTLRRLLPTHEQLERLAADARRHDAKVIELDELLGRDEFDAARAERRLRDAERAGGAAALEQARLVSGGVATLTRLRERAAGERDALCALMTRLRLQLTVLRFAGPGAGDVADVVGEIVARVEGVGESFVPGPDPLPPERGPWSGDATRRQEEPHLR